MTNSFDKNTNIKQMISSMYGLAKTNNDITSIFISTESMGEIRLFGVNMIELRLYELLSEENEPREKIYQYSVSDKVLNDTKCILQAANAANRDDTIKAFKIFTHTFYLGDIQVIRESSTVEFFDDYFVIYNGDIIGDKYYQIMIPYSDFRGIKVL